MAVPSQAYHQIAQKLLTPSPAPAVPWTAPAMSELVARIDAALTARRAA